MDGEPDVWVAAEPGQSEEVAEYVASKNPVAVGADTWGLDVVPPKLGSRLPRGCRESETTRSRASNDSAAESRTKRRKRMRTRQSSPGQGCGYLYQS